MPSLRPPPRVVAGRELLFIVAPLGFLVDGRVGQAPEPPDNGAVGLDRGSRERRAGRLIHERHELVRESWHGTADADAAYVRAASDAVHPAPIGYVAVDDGAQQPIFTWHLGEL